MSDQIPENRKISPSLVFFIISTMQAGIGILGFQRIIAMTAGYDAWMSIIIAGFIINIVVWMMFKMNEIAEGDIVSIHSFILGKKISKLISSLFVIYFCLLSVVILRNFVEIVQVWMFPGLETFWFSLIFLILVVYIIYGGFRTVTGVAYFSVVLPFYILFMFVLTLPFADFTNLLPIFDHSVKELLFASKDLSLTILGFETLLVFYPFIKNPGKSKKWAHGAIIFTTFNFLYLAIITFAYFPEAQLQKNIWPTLTMWKIIKLPFVERFEYIGIANWCLIILPNACISLWCGSRILKVLFSIRQKISVPALALICLMSVSMLTTRDQINFVTDITGRIGFYLNFVYFPLLFVATLIAKKVKTRANKV
jgi:spore germination protein (amino acid permease)